MRSNRKQLGLIVSLVVAATLGVAGRAHAQDKGFQLERYEPTPAGTWFFSVDHPWYSGTRYFAAGLTLDYGHNPLVFGARDPNDPTKFTQQNATVAHQLVGHVDVAVSFFDRFAITGSLPVTLLERGTAELGVAPVSGAVVGDPRFGFMLSVFNHPERDPFSVGLGVNVWAPIGAAAKHAGDNTVRVLPKLILGGTGGQVRWALTGGYLVRSAATLSSSAAVAAAGNTTADELQIGAGLGFVGREQRFNIGPEANLSSIARSGNFFRKDYTSLELLLGLQYLIGESVIIGVAGGGGVTRLPGTPDGRVIARLAYAPRSHAPPPPADTDGDGITDREDACPLVAGVRTNNFQTNGCPPPPDRDADGVLDHDDYCPDVPKGDHPDPARPGCPAKDRDGDGVYDFEDQCPDVPKGDHPDLKRLGCPAIDNDGDGVYDYEDQCPDVPQGVHPDPDRKGCPQPDRDRDNVPDRVDACPDKPGAPDPDPKKNGCPGLVEVRNGQIVILQPVFFATDKDKILARSFPLLKAVANALIAQPEIKKVAVEGHTDDRGKRDHNLDLSQRRAASVMKFLIEQGIAGARLEAHGYGPDRPVMPNLTAIGRSANRRVEFVILDPAPPKQ